ncbi:polysaccharide biosynthesis C-terminal domain-containing protein [Peribacillus sp. SIMBA_075]|uniref:lipopolysaccharide biosynthesis protein n=3 Tax=Bacillati TaxID=1783272 RepID=UPI00397D5C7E
MNSYNKLAKNSTIFAIGNIGSKFITLLMLPFYTRQFSQNDYGQIDLFITTIALLMPIFTASIVEAIVRFSLDKKNYTYGEVITNSIAVVFLGFTLLLTLYPLLINISFVEQFILFFYIVFFVQAIDTSIKQFARSIDLIKVYMISDILYTFVFVVLNILFIFVFEMGVDGYFISMILAYSVNITFLSIKTKVINYIRLKYLDKTTMKSMILFCIPLIPNNLMWWVINISDRYMLVYFLGFGANGLYSVATKFPSIISNLYVIFYKAWQVSAIEEYESSNKNIFYSNIFNLLFFVMLIAASVYIIFNKLFVHILVSNEFYSVWKYTPILVLAAVFSCFSSFIGTNYIAMKKTKGALYTSFIGAIINFILNVLLIPFYGVYGACVATMISFLTIWVLRINDTRKFVKINYPKMKMIFSFILVGVQLIIGYLDINIITKSCINFIVLLTLIYLSLEFTKKPIILIFNKFLYLFKKVRKT